MNKRMFMLATSLILFFLFLARGNALAFGHDFVFPGPRRSVISGFTFLDPPTHQAYDYRFGLHTKVAAAKAGTIATTRWDMADDSDETPCTGVFDDRGNHVIINHGGSLQTWYFHLSNTGRTPGNGTVLALGEYIAYSGETGCGGPHLHFATKLDGVPFDPYAGSTHWAGGMPIPMGYRDQNGSAQGPFALDNVKIRDKWLQLQGMSGAPIEDVWTDLCDAGGLEAPTTEYIQRFEKGYIHYCGSASAEYVTNGYNNYLFDLKARYSCGPGENSRIVIENTSDFPAIVSITLLDNANQVRDTRVYKPLNPGGSWEFSVRAVYYDWLVQEPPWVFEGDALISADMNVDVYHSYDDSTDCKHFLPKISR